MGFALLHQQLWYDQKGVFKRPCSCQNPSGHNAVFCKGEQICLVGCVDGLGTLMVRVSKYAETASKPRLTDGG